MSGDVQPRKRKDKRRKKEDAPSTEEPAVQQQGGGSQPNDDFTIHVHSDHGTGGGICAKLIFFVLLSLLAALTGIIISQNRGLTDLDIAPTESRFAKVFDGWLDESVNDHDDEDHHAHAIDDHDDHEVSEEEGDHDEDELEQHEGDEDDHEDETEEDDHQDDEDEQNTEEDEDQEISEEEEEQIDNDDDDEDEDQEDTEEIDEQASEEPQISDEDEQDDESDQQEDDEDDDNDVQEDEVNEVQESDENDNADDDIETDEDNDTLDVSNEEIEQEKDNDSTPDDNDDDDDDDANDNFNDDDDDEIEQTQSDEDDTIAQGDDNSRENEILDEDSTEVNPEIDGIDDQDEEVIDNTAGEEEALKEEAEKQIVVEEESSSMAVKFGVGVALVVVAHIVLVRKWRSAQANVEKPVEEEIVSDLSRRNTIVAPAPPEQLEAEIQNIEDEYSEEEDDEEDEVSEEEIIIQSVSNQPAYKELHFTYIRSLPSENITKESLEAIGRTAPKQNIFYVDKDDDEVEEEEDEEDEEGDEGEDVEDNEEDEEADDDAEEVEDDDNEDISDVDDEELLKKLEAKYGKLPSSRDNEADKEHIYDEPEGDERFESWKRVKVLPDNDSEGSEEEDNWTKQKGEKVPPEIKQKMKLAETSVHDNTELALNLYTNLMAQLPNNLQIKYGRAKALDKLAEMKRSNELLQDAISSYYDLLQSPDISDEKYELVAERCIDRIRFRGHYNRAVEVHKQIIDRFPKSPKYRNQLAVTLLTSNRLAEAKHVLHEVLLHWPNNGFAQAHYGFVLKTKDNNMETAVKYLKAGIKSRESGVIDGRFYFHLGDALTRLGRNEEAMKIYEDGVQQKVFLSKYQRSLYNVDRLTARPWWELNQTPYVSFFHLLEEKWRIIREEGLALLNKAGYFKDEAENLRDTGDWKQFELFARGQKFHENCKKCPETCKLIENFPDAKGCRRGQVKFSIMHPGTHVWSHCGPSNCRLRAHLGLKVPPKTYIRVADDIRSWEKGKIILFDDSFEHEVWHNGSDIRLVLIVDVWHPELTSYEKRSLPAI